MVDAPFCFFYLVALCCCHYLRWKLWRMAIDAKCCQDKKCFFWHKNDAQSVTVGDSWHVEIGLCQCDICRFCSSSRWN